MTWKRALIILGGALLALSWIMPVVSSDFASTGRSLGATVWQMDRLHESPLDQWIALLTWTLPGMIGLVTVLSEVLVLWTKRNFWRALWPVLAAAFFVWFVLISRAGYSALYRMYEYEPPHYLARALFTAWMLIFLFAALWSFGLKRDSDARRRAYRMLIAFMAAAFLASCTAILHIHFKMYGLEASAGLFLGGVGGMVSVVGLIASFRGLAPLPLDGSEELRFFTQVKQLSWITAVALVLLCVAALWLRAAGKTWQRVGDLDWATPFPYRQFSPDASRVLLGSEGEGHSVWKVETGQKVAELEEKLPLYLRCVFSADGSRIQRTISSKSDRYQTEIWNADTGKRIHSLETNENSYRAVSMSPDGAYVFAPSSVAESQHRYFIWHLPAEDSEAPPVPPIPLRAKNLNPRIAAWSPDSRRLFLIDLIRGAYVWDVDVAKFLPQKQISIIGGEHAQFSPDGSAVAVWSRTSVHVVSLPDLASQSVNPSLDLLPMLMQVQWSPDGRLLAVASFDGYVQILDRNLAHILQGPAYCSQFSRYGTTFIHRLAWNYDGQFVLAVDDDGGIHVWYLHDDVVVHVQEGEGTERFMGFDSNLGRIYTAPIECGPVHVWEQTRPPGLLGLLHVPALYVTVLLLVATVWSLRRDLRHARAAD